MTCSESSVEVPVTVCVAIGVATRSAAGTSGPAWNASSRVSTVPAGPRGRGDALRRLDVTALATLSAQESTIATPSTPGPPRLLTTRYTTPSEMPVPAWKMNWSLDAGSEFTEIPIPCFVLFFSCPCS